jgi:hypothetical protein
MKSPPLHSLLITTSITAILTLASPAKAGPHTIELAHIGKYPSGLFDAGGAEIVAHDPATQTLFVVNAQAATVDVLSIANPSQPAKVSSIEVAPFGAVANSVAVHNGIIAVAVENVVKTDPGKVVFFNANLSFLNQVTVGPKES